MASILDPAIQLMNRLSFAKKFSLIAILFVSILVSPMWELYKAVNDSANFSAQELDGAKYIEPTAKLLEEIIAIKQGSKSEISAAQLSALATAEKEVGGKFKTAEEYKKFTLLSKNIAADPQAAIDSTLNLITLVQFPSNLILDPDADSYSLMDTTVLKMPWFYDALEKTRVLLTENTELTRNQTIELARLKTNMDIKLSLMKADYDTATNHTNKADLKAQLDKTYPAFIQNAEAYLNLIESGFLAESQTPYSIQERNDAAVKAFESGTQLYKSEMDLMKELIQIRIAGIYPKLYSAVTIAIILFAVIAYLLFGFYQGVIHAIAQLDKTSKDLAEGDLTVELKLDTQDELSSISGSFNHIARSFRSLIQTIRNRALALSASAQSMTETSTGLASTATQMTAMASSTADAVEQLDSNIRTVAAAIEESSANISQVNQSSQAIQESITNVKDAADNTTSYMQTVAAAAEEMSASVSTVASAIEEMTSSLAEVSKNAGQAAIVTDAAQKNASNTLVTIDQLNTAAKDISNVIETIQAIAAQTNLLALNATIEAASAGDAGKGFAVVANEVKDLARQSAEASEGIKHRIEEMQKSTQESVSAIHTVADIISQINQINTSIATAIGQQTSAANEISRSVVGAAQASKEVSENVQKTANAAGQVELEISQVTSNITAVSRNMDDLTYGIQEISQNATRAAVKAQDITQSVDTVKVASQETNQGAGKTKDASDNLSELAQELQRLVDPFRV